MIGKVLNMKNMKISTIISIVFWGLMTASAWVSDFAPDFKREKFPLQEQDEYICGELIDLSGYFPAAGKELFRGDLNGDGEDDYIGVVSNCGLGIMAWYSDVYFILSSPQGKKITKLGTMAFEDLDVIRIGGGAGFIRCTLEGDEKFIYELYVFGADGSVSPDKNNLIPGFPYKVRFDRFAR